MGCIGTANRCLRGHRGWSHPAGSLVPAVPEGDAVTVENVNDVAAGLLLRTGRIAPTKFQKLLYYAQAWNLATTGEALFEDRIEAWTNGPVVADVWRAHREETYLDSWPDGDVERLGSSALHLLDWVTAAYGHLSPTALSNLTHAEAPWREARRGVEPGRRSSREIAPSAMATFYRRFTRPETPGRDARAIVELEGVDLSDEVVASLQAVADGSLPADRVIARRLAQL
jgi:uncharacterized phage-associated protein